MMNGINAFVDKYAEFNEISKKQSKEEILRFVDTFKRCTEEYNGVNISGFLKSEVVDVPAKKCRNPKTGEMISVPAKKVVKVKVSSKFKNLEE